MRRSHLPIYLALLPTTAYAHGGALAYVAVLFFLYVASVVLAPMVAARGRKLIATIATLIGFPAFFMAAQWVTGVMHGGGRDTENALAWTMYLAAPLWLAIVFRASRRPRKRNTAGLKTAQANSTIWRGSYRRPARHWTILPRLATLRINLHRGWHYGSGGLSWLPCPFCLHSRPFGKAWT